MNTFLHDIRYGVRMLVKAPGFALVAIITLALGIGANTTMFSVIDAVLLEQAPFRDPRRLVMVWERNYVRGRKTNVVGPANYLRWREQNQVFEDLGAYIAFDQNVIVNGSPERLHAGIATPSLFSTLGTTAHLGRVFLPEEEQPGKDNVVLLGYGYWRQRFGADPAVIGKDMVFSGNPVKIVGVLPPNFDLFEKVSIWTTLTIRPQTRNAGGRYFTVIARLKPGVTVPQAQAAMDIVANNTRAELKDWDAGWGVNVVPFNEQMVGGLRRALLVLLGAVGFVLLIASANVANLLLAKASAREKEIAIRAALGVSRTRLLRQLLTESTILALGGGIAGIALAYWAVDAVVAIAPAAFPGYANIHVNFTVLAFTFAISVGAGILFGLVPAFRALRTDPQYALKEGTRTSAGARHQRVRNVLVVVEAATALVLLVGAGLLVRSFERLMRVDPGFQPEGVLTMEVSLSGDTYRKGDAQWRFFQEAVERVQRIPGVTAAGAISWLPLIGLGSATDFTVDDLPKPKAGEEPVADVRAITPDYFRAMGIRVLRGRSFDPAQDHPDDAIKKIVVNQTTVDMYWPGQDPIGKTIHMDWGSMLRAQVVGVVSEVKSAKLEAATHKPMLYWYLPQFPNSFMTIVARTTGDPKALIPSVRAQVSSIDPTIPVANFRTMEDVVGIAVREPRFTTVLLAIFAGLALALAAIGLYGVISYSVTQRQHELGIRMALGARTGDVSRMVVAEGMRLALVGAAAGLVLAFALARFLQSLVFGISTWDAVTFTAVAALVCLVALLASYLPARRATRVDPMIALRYE